jgi:hypothetical protein
MRGRKVNERILEAIRKNSEADESIQDFLIEMIYEEATNPGQFKELYKKKIKEYVIKESGEDED